MTIYEEIEKSVVAEPREIIEVEAGNFINLINIWRTSSKLVEQIHEDLFEESLETIEKLTRQVLSMADWCDYDRENI